MYPNKKGKKSMINEVKYKEFWDWFEANQGKYYEINPDNANVLLTKINTRIRRVDKHLTVLFGLQETNGKKEIVLTAEGKKEGFPSAFALANAAPNFERWIVQPLKPKADISEFSDFGIQWEGRRFDAKNYHFNYSIGFDGKLDIGLFYRNFQPNDLDVVGSAFLMILDMILGEYDTVTNIGKIDIQKLTSTNGLHPLQDMIQIVEQHKKR